MLAIKSDASIVFPRNCCINPPTALSSFMLCTRVVWPVRGGYKGLHQQVLFLTQAPSC